MCVSRRGASGVRDDEAYAWSGWVESSEKEEEEEEEREGKREGKREGDEKSSAKTGSHISQDGDARASAACGICFGGCWCISNARVEGGLQTAQMVWDGTEESSGFVEDCTFMWRSASLS